MVTVACMLLVVNCTQGDDSDISLGRVNDADGSAQVNGERAAANRELRTGDSIETGQSGSIDFSLAPPTEVECRALSRSRIAVSPSGDVVLKWSDSVGVSFCDVRTHVESARFKITDDATIEASGALFAIGHGVLRVIEGVIVLRVGDTRNQLEPKAQIRLPGAPVTGRPPPPTWERLTDAEQEIVDVLRERRD
jgi:hypothetical protein